MSPDDPVDVDASDGVEVSTGVLVDELPELDELPQAAPTNASPTISEISTARNIGAPFAAQVTRTPGGSPPTLASRRGVCHEETCKPRYMPGLAVIATSSTTSIRDTRKMRRIRRHASGLAGPSVSITRVMRPDSGPRTTEFVAALSPVVARRRATAA